MSVYLDEAKRLRAITDVHYNCAQSVLLAFASEYDIPEKELYDLSVHFGGGMKMGGTCGALTGALMALGLLGIDSVSDANAIEKKVREAHDGMLECRDLLRVNAEKGGEKKPHCDAMVYECVGYVEQMLEEKRKA